MSVGYVVQGYRNRWLRVCTRRVEGGKLQAIGRMWEGDAYYATVFATRELADDYVARRQPLCSFRMWVRCDPLGRDVETLGRRDCFRG